MSTTETRIRPLPRMRPPRRGGREGRAVTVVIGVLLAAGAFATAFPFIWMVFASVKPRSESVAYPPSLLPQEPTLEFFRQLFVELDFGRYLVNTLAIVLISMVGLVIMAAAGYGFAKFSFRGRDALFFLVLVTMMIPVQVTMIPTYLILNGMKLTNTLVGIALPTLVSGFSIFLFRQFMSTIPTEMLEAARLDGAGEFRIFRSIVLPNAVPALLTLAIFTFMYNWNDLLWPLVFTTSPEMGTITSGLTLLTGPSGIIPYGTMMAGSLIAVLPLAVMFLIMQRRFIESVATTGLK